jgi:hypothetical protein
MAKLNFYQNYKDNPKKFIVYLKIILLKNMGIKIIDCSDSRQNGVKNDFI